ncbi:tripartite tricarboxylate transporter permease [Rossellomorea vietnamensis]|uniref:tripartite tricarboxylate transporter permease n=1 Tax=Rossellomorea vietnamensis TaxID=218284 RepID=UPI001CCE4094|nr:tripartite tricarboxylate transporter permease [Rossellomorea vietnamensis]MCA0150423.1 tripartite tricarboxylate transporter permease [Rossellomorea vietnamensis]
MMDIQLLVDGLLTTLTPMNLLLVFVGMLVGVFFGSLPGISSSMGIVLMLPFTYYMGILPSIMLLVALYAGSSYGGSITAILFNTPGTPESVATTFDGYPMTKNGKAGRALSLAISASAFGGIFSVLIMLFLAPPLSTVALNIQSAEYFALTVLGLTVISSIGTKSPIKAITSGLIGILIAMIGMDPIVGANRFTFGNIELMNGLEMIPIMIGAFALAEVLNQVTDKHKDLNMSNKVSLETIKIVELIKHKWVLLKSAVIGTVIGILPGTGGSIASIVSYGEAMRTSKHKESFGQGEEEGVVAPEAANNAAAGGAMIPTLVLGIPGSPTTAIILAALALQGLQPGPQLMTEQPLMLYCIFFSMLIASVTVFIGGRLGVKAFAAILKLPYSMLGTLIVLLSMVGSYAVGNSMFNVWVMLVFGILGYFMKKYHFSPASLVLGLVLGPMMEENFRRNLLVTEGDYLSFITKPISGIILFIAVLAMFYPIIAKAFKKKKGVGGTGVGL